MEEKYFFTTSDDTGIKKEMRRLITDAENYFFQLIRSLPMSFL
jgi:hypothetical protein